MESAQDHLDLLDSGWSFLYGGKGRIMLEKVVYKYSVWYQGYVLKPPHSGLVWAVMVTTASPALKVRHSPSRMFTGVSWGFVCGCSMSGLFSAWW